LDIEAVYLLLKDGRCVYSRAYSENPTDPQILGGMISAFHLASKQWLRNGISKFESDGGASFIVKDFETFIVAFQISAPLSSERESYLDTIGYRFLAKFSDTLSPFLGETSIYRSFTPILDNILDINLDSSDDPNQNVIIRGTISEDKVLDSIAIIELPKHLQKIAMELLVLKKTTPEKLARVIGLNSEETEENLEDLLHQGFIMCRQKGNKKLYYIP
jgi:hypothetical protein